MTNIEKLSDLANRFQTNLAYYKDAKNNYNEHSCRIEYIDPSIISELILSGAKNAERFGRR